MPPSDAPTHPLHVRDLGRMPYVEALTRQYDVNQQVIADDAAETVLLVEHEPVITVSHRKTAAQHLLASRERLAALGIDVQPTDRGGDVTYHGPGQLVAYPILRLAPRGLNLSRYMRLLERIVIDTLDALGVPAFRDEQATGVWVRPNAFAQAEDREAGDSDAITAKVCAMGVRVRKNVTMHGLALNVNPDLTHFQTIVPCGLHDRGVTSLQALLGEQAPQMNQVKTALIAQMQRAFQIAPPAAGHD